MAGRNGVHPNGIPRPVVNALLLGLTLLALQEVDSVFTGALRGAQRFDLAAKVEITLRVFGSSSCHHCSDDGEPRCDAHG
jgi:hypothetical protein